MDIRFPFDSASVHDPDRWQPLRYVDGSGALVTPAFVGVQWQRVAPFAMASNAELRSPTGPATFGTEAYHDQCRQLIDRSAALTDEEKMIAEYWADGPHSELPPGHWNLFAQQVFHRDRTGDSEHDLDQAVKLFFALTNAIFDAGICAWDNKRAYDSVRPITAIRMTFRGQPIRSWAGPGRGTQTILGEQWFPYQPTTFPTPPFPEYSSGHSNFSAAGAILQSSSHRTRWSNSTKQSARRPHAHLGHLLQRRRPSGPLPPVRRHPLRTRRPRGPRNRPHGRATMLEEGAGLHERHGHEELRNARAVRAPSKTRSATPQLHPRNP